MNRSNDDLGDLERLDGRIGRIHLRQRLGIEIQAERVFGQGRTFFHIENLASLAAVMRGLLRLSLLAGRGRRNARAIKVREHEIRLRRLPAAFDGYRILHVTDLHLDMSDDMAAVLADAIRGLSYDLCVLTGDFRAETHGPWQPCVAALAEVIPEIKTASYAVLGNHDSIRMVPAMEDLGLQVLLNEFVVLERDAERVYLAGVDDPHFFRADNLEKAADEIPEDACSILLAHSPEIYRQAAHADFELLLCGHTHGGQICLPGGRPLMLNADCPREFGKGAWNYLRLQGFTSTGSGVCVVDARFNCPPEIVVHRLRSCASP